MCMAMFLRETTLNVNLTREVRTTGVYRNIRYSTQILGPEEIPSLLSGTHEGPQRARKA